MHGENPKLSLIIFILCRIFLSSFTLRNTFLFLTWLVQMISSILLQYHISKFSSISDRPSKVSMFHPIQSYTPNNLMFSDRASWIDYISITNLMHWLLFIYKILFSSTCFEPQVLIVRRIQLYTCSIWYCHILWWPVGAQLAVHRQATTDSRREWQYYMLHVYNCILLKMTTWGSKHVEENNIFK